MPPILRAAAWMALAIVSFLSLAVAVRELSQGMSLFEVLTFRSLIGIALLLPLLLRNPAALRTARPGLHLLRNLIHFGGQYSWTLGVTLLPLAEVFALEFTTPIWVALLAALFLGERFSGHRLLTALVGFVGVLIILRPGVAAIQPAALIVLGAALCFAASLVMVKSLTRTDAPLTILFYMGVIQLPMGLLPALTDWVMPAWRDLPWLLVVSVAALSAHYGLTRAIAIADVSVIGPLDFLRLPAVAFLGYFLYGEALNIWTFVGAGIIFGANYYGVLQEAKRLNPKPAKALN